jgi:hypothetical protein
MYAVPFWFPDASASGLPLMQPRFHPMIPTAAFARILQNLQKLTGISTFMP